MKAFTFVRPRQVDEASRIGRDPGSVFKAGGIDLLDRMKERVDEPDKVIWLGELIERLDRIEVGVEPRVLWLGAMVTLERLAAAPEVRSECSALAEAAALAASPQIRQRATLGGNLCQHTRCGYYRHVSLPCYKRGDARCPVLEDGAVQDTAAVFDNRSCASASPSSLAPVLCACQAQYFTRTGEKRQQLVMKSVASDLYATPWRGRRSDTTLDDGAFIDTISVPRVAGRRSVFEEVRQKAAFDWALVSCCVRLDMDGDKVKDAGIWLGSVAPTPWHAEAAEKAIVGKPLTDETIAAAAEAAVAGATPLPGNAYKVDLVKVVVRRALERLRAMK